MKIYDCFTFFNELDLLEIRLEELYDCVDYFVIVEANKTFSGEEKEFILEKNLNRFKKWRKKIIYVKIEDMPKINKFSLILQKLMYKLHPYSPIPLEGLAIHLHLGKWKTQNFQRNQIIKGLQNAKDEDIVIISDLDEIPRKNKIPEIEKSLSKGYNRVILNTRFYCYYLNGFIEKEWNRIKACKFSALKYYFQSKPQEVRGGWRDSNFLQKFIKNNEKTCLIKDAGWHFSYLGDTKKLLKKISALSGMEKGLKEYGNQLKLKKLIEEGKYLIEPKFKIKYVKIDESFPKAVQKNKKKYRHLIKC